MAHMISEIVKEIKESNPEEIVKANKPGCNASNVSDILEAEGFLCRDERGRHPTPYGNSRGITEELRTKATGEEYYQILYSDEAKDMVRAIVFRYYPDLDPDRRITFKHKVVAPFAGRGINASRLIAEEYPGYAIIMFCGTDYRAFEDSAVTLSQMLNLRLFENAHGINSVVMREDVLKDLVIPFLANGDKSFIVNMEDGLHIYKAVRKATVRPRPVTPVIQARQPAGREVRFGLCAEIVRQNSLTEKVFLATREHCKRIVIHHGNGTEEIISVPITSMEDVKILSPYNPLSRALIGCRENTSFVCEGERIFIRRVFRSETVNDQTIR